MLTSLYEIILPGPFCTEAFFFYIFEFHVKSNIGRVNIFKIFYYIRIVELW